VTSDVAEATQKAQIPEIATAALGIDVILKRSETAESVWDQIHRSEDVSILRAYQQRFPDSPRFYDAQDRIDLLGLKAKRQ
jgi:hypothetical protein